MKTAISEPESTSTAEKQPSYIKWFREIGIEDVALVGGKTASLGEMFRELMSKGVKVPDGFAITAQAYRDFLREAELDRKIDNLLRGLDTRNVDAIRDCGSTIREAILSAPFPGDLESDILAAYDQLQQIGDATAGVAVRSSATAEDFTGSEFRGPTGNVFERARPSRVNRCLPTLFRFALYRSRDFLSRR